MTQKEKIIWLITIFASVWLINSCITMTAKPSGQPGKLIVNAARGPVALNVFIADTPKTRVTGLMNRQHLDGGDGMLFVFEKMARHNFWMKDTYLPLDLIFFDDEFRVVGIMENATPLSEATLDIKVSSRYVLEVNAGFVKKYGVTLATTATWEKSK